MAAQLIGYDLNKPEKDYPKLLEKIRSMFGTRWHNLDSTWIVETDMSSAAIRDALKPYIDSNDELLVVGLSGEGAWTGFSTAASDWLKKHL